MKYSTQIVVFKLNFANNLTKDASDIAKFLETHDLDLIKNLLIIKIIKLVNFKCF